MSYNNSLFTAVVPLPSSTTITQEEKEKEKEQQKQRIEEAREAIAQAKHELKSLKKELRESNILRKKRDIAATNAAAAADPTQRRRWPRRPYQRRSRDANRFEKRLMRQLRVHHGMQTLSEEQRCLVTILSSRMTHVSFDLRGERPHGKEQNAASDDDDGQSSSGNTVTTSEEDGQSQT
jgi:hypothetical protein